MKINCIGCNKAVTELKMCIGFFKTPSCDNCGMFANCLFCKENIEFVLYRIDTLNDPNLNFTLISRHFCASWSGKLTTFTFETKIVVCEVMSEFSWDYYASENMTKIFDRAGSIYDKLIVSSEGVMPVCRFMELIHFS